jgi:hypothetical protein
MRLFGFQSIVNLWKMTVACTVALGIAEGCGGGVIAGGKSCCNVLLCKWVGLERVAVQGLQAWGCTSTCY